MEHLQPTTFLSKQMKQGANAMYKCLCCGLETLPVPPEEAIAFICPVCWWENDVFIKSDDELSDENKGITLNEARANYKKCSSVATF